MVSKSFLYKHAEGNIDRSNHHQLLVSRHTTPGSGNATMDAAKNARRVDHTTFWNRLDRGLLNELEAKIPSEIVPQTSKLFPGETWFGMAASVVHYADPGFKEKHLIYNLNAAYASLPAAQGIIGRLLQASGWSSNPDQETQVAWLVASVSTGSLIAADDLARMDEQAYQQADSVFRKLGGYNGGEQIVRDITPEEVCDILSEPNPESLKRACDKLGRTDFLLDTDGNGLLHHAAMFNKLESIRYLVTELKVDVNTRNFAGETPLYKCCLAGHEEVVKLLIQCDADATIPANPFGVTCMHWLFNFKDCEMESIANLLVISGGAAIDAIAEGQTDGKWRQHILTQHFPYEWPWGTPLHWAVAARSKVAADLLLKMGGNINALDSKTPTARSASPLVTAVYRQDARMIQFLLTKGASADLFGEKKRSLLHLLVIDHLSISGLFPLPRCVRSWVSFGSSEKSLESLRKCIRLLVSRGCDIDYQDQRSHTPLADAIRTKNSCAAYALLEAGANADFEFPGGGSLLHDWLQFDARCLDYPEMYSPVLQKLLDLCETIDRRDIFGSTIFEVAVGARSTNQQFENSLTSLLARGSPPTLDTPNQYGETPLMSLLKSHDSENTFERVKVLLSKGAKATLKNLDDEDCLYLLCANSSMCDADTLAIAISVLSVSPPLEQRQIASKSHSRRSGRTALMKAVEDGKFECVEYLTRLKIDVNVLGSSDNRTALDQALRTADASRSQFAENLMKKLGRAKVQPALDDSSAFEHAEKGPDTVTMGPRK